MSARSTKANPSPTPTSPVNWGIITAVILLFIGTLAWLLTSRIPVMELPRVDLSEIDPMIINQIQQAEGKIKQDPSSASAWAVLGITYWVNEMKEPGGRCLAHAFLLEPKQGRWLYYEGLSFLPDRIPEAVERIRIAADMLEKQHFAPRLRLANILAEDGQMEAAKPHYQHVLERYPGNPMALLGLGRVSQASGNEDQAVAYFEQCTQARETRKAAHTALANLYLRQGSIEASENAQQLADAIEMDDEWEDPFLSLVKPYRLGQTAWMDSAGSLMRRGQLQQARPLVEKIIQTYPDISKAHIYMGKILLAEKNHSDAEAALRKAFKLDPQSVEAMVQLGVSLLWQNKHAEAIDFFNQAIEKSPDLAEAYYNLALSHSSLGQIEPAKTAFAHTLRLNPGIAEAYVGLATMFIQNKELSNALKTVRKGLEVAPNHPQLLSLLQGFEIKP